MPDLCLREMGELSFSRHYVCSRPNATAKDKVHVTGVDVQDTQLPVALLLSKARALKLTSDDQQMLQQLGEKRGAPVRAFTKERRSALDSLLARFVNNKDLRIAIAARSLVVQVGYLDGVTLGAGCV